MAAIVRHSCHPMIRHQAFLDLEESLAARLRQSWSRYWSALSADILQLTARGEFDAAHRLADTLDLAPLFDKVRPYARTIGMSALLLGASRITPSIRSSRIAKVPPKQKLDSYLNQLQTMLARNATQALRLMVHEWITAEEQKLVKGDYVGHPFRGNQYTTVVGTPGIHTIRVKRQRVQVIVNPARTALARFAADIGHGRLLRYIHRGKDSIWWNAADATHWQMIEALRLYEEGKEYKDSEMWSGDAYQIGNSEYKNALARLDEFGVYKADWREEDHPRGKTTPESTPGSFISVTGTPEFKEWFGKSKVVDKDGKPLKVFHGTRNVFSVFNTRREGAHFGTAEQANARVHNQGHVLPVYLSIQNPIRLPDLNTWSTHNVIPQLVKLGAITKKQAERVRLAVEGGGGSAGWTELKALLAKKGIDGIVYANEQEGEGDSYLAFHSWQIKSAFNPHPTKDPDIMKVEKADVDRNQVKIMVAGKQYFALAASVQVSRLSAFGFLAEAAERGVKNYRVDAVLDEHTCEVCRHMDGWVFPVDAGLALATQIMDTDDPDALKAIAPFYAQNKASIAALATYGTEDFIEEGMSLPPYHPLCRCILTPTEETADVHPTDRSDRVALAAQALYGEGEGVRLTQNLFGVERLPEATDTVAAPETEEDSRIMEMLSGLLREPATQEEPGFAQSVMGRLLAPEVQLAALVQPTAFEGTTIPSKWVAPFDPKRLAGLASSRWPWLAGILGWLALREPKQESAFAVDEDADEEDEETP